MIARLIASLLTVFLGTIATAETLRLAVTTSFDNAGLSDVLLPEIRADTGVRVQLLVVGTGQALRLGRAGDVDAILVHSKQAELDFVAAGFATARHEIMYNDFVLIGPASDPAGIAGAVSATDALTRIADTQSRFVSRGDDSGTHRTELALWAATDLMPEGGWYTDVGAGMGAALNTAAGLDAYIVADRASWLNFGNKSSLALLYAGDPVLFNQYAYLPVNPAKHPHVNARAALALGMWLRSPRAKELINGYQIDGETLFVFNAEIVNGPVSD